MVDVRMTVRFGHPTVRGPARVADTDLAGQPLGMRLLQRGQVTHAARQVQPLFGNRHHPRRVIPAVLEPPQTADHDLPRCLAPDVTHDAAHALLLSSAVDASANLPGAQLRRLEPQPAQLFGDALENLRVALPLRLQLRVPPRDEL